MKMLRLASLLLAMGLLGGCGASCSVPEPAPESSIVRGSVSTTQAHYGWSVNYPKQRKLFWIHERFWAFYSNGRDSMLRTSADGISWSPATTIKANGHYGHRTSFWFDGSYIHYAHNAAGPGEAVVYRRGKPEATGAITWSHAEQVVARIPSRHNVMYPKVIVDSLGHPWVSYVHCKGGPHDAPYDAVLLRSASNDGTWKTASGFPFRLVTDNPDSYPDVAGTPLSQGKVYWMSNRKKGQRFVGRLWDGKAWREAEEVSDWGGSHGLFNLLAEGDVVHVAYRTASLHYRRREASGQWGKEQTIDGGGKGSGHVSLTLVAPGHLLFTWLHGDRAHVYGRERIQDVWQPPVLLADASTLGLSGSPTTQGINHNALLQAPPHLRLAMLYTTGTRAPFSLEFLAWRR